MIRILHTSDWHLGKRLERFSRHEEQLAVLDEITEIAEREQVDAVLVAGDLFDTFNPPAESLELFYRSLKRLAKNGARAVVAIAGNHDMPERIEAPDPLARECGIIFSGFPDSTLVPFSLENGFSISKSEPGFIEIQLEGKPALRVLLTPYANEMRLRKGLQTEDSEDELRQFLANHWGNLAEKFCDEKGVNLLLSHLLFMPEGSEIPEEPEDERPINHLGGAQAVFTSAIPAAMQYVALGHLHRKITMDNRPCPVIYCGSPISYSFSEAGQQKYVVIVDLEPGKAAIVRPVELSSGRKLERKRFENPEEAENWLRQNPGALVELTLVTENYLSGADRRKLNEIHDGIVAIIPEIKFTASGTDSDPVQTGSHSIDRAQLFVEYFINRRGQPPDEALTDLFREVISESDET